MTHWLILEEVILKLEDKAPELAGILKKHKAAARLGAMLHDAPYYYQFGGKPPEVMAALLHGSYKNNTFEPLVRLASYIQASKKKDTEKELLWSTLFGMISHFAADIEFHPFVYFQTGDYYHLDAQERLTARRRHRLLEVYIDSWFGKELKERFGEASARSLARDYFELSGERSQIETMLNEVLKIGKFSEIAGEVDQIWGEASFWRGSIRYLVFCQMAFESTAGGMLLRGLKKVVPGKVDGIDALASWGRSQTGALEGVHQFCNPFTGEKEEESLEGGWG